MIDTMFFLLIFFILSSLSLTSLGGFAVNLPTAQTNELPEKKEMILSITKDLRYSLNANTVTRQDLGEALLAYLFDHKIAVEQASVMLKADREVPYGVVVETLDAIKKLGIKKFGIVAERR
jgi:biopolymer transport protein ExbD